MLFVEQRGIYTAEEDGTWVWSEFTEEIQWEGSGNWSFNSDELILRIEDFNPMPIRIEDGVIYTDDITPYEMRLERVGNPEDEGS